MNQWMKTHKFEAVAALLIAAAVTFLSFLSPAKSEDPQVIESTLTCPTRNPFTNFIEPIFVADNPNINHARYSVPESMIISLENIVEYEVKLKNRITLREGKSDKYPIITVVPEGVTMTREQLYADGWIRVSYGGKTGYIRADEASMHVIPVVWSEDTQWAELNREDGRKKIGVSAIENALTQLLKPYEWGAEGLEDYDHDGDTRPGFDCSGLTQWAFHQEGVDIPRTTARGFDQGIQIQRKDIEIGDLIYFNPPSSFAPVSHVGMYMGNDMMLHATGAFMEVGISRVYWDRMVSIVRYE